MHFRAAAFGLLMALPAAHHASAAESVYTNLNFSDDSCKPVNPVVTKEDEEMGVVAVTCPGYKGYSVQFDSNDERESVHYGDPATATTGTAWESFAPFNSIVDKVEWRLEGGVPFAAIQRFMISTGEEEPAPSSTDKRPIKGQVLVVSKVGQPDGPSGCVVGLVDALANPDANDLARNIADTLARSFRCGQNKAAYHGKRGDKAADLQANFGE
jgi:hypothetical protein